MQFDTTYSLYVTIFSATEKAGPLAQTGDPDAIEVMVRLMPIAELLSRKLRRQLATAIEEIEAEPKPAAEADNLNPVRGEKQRRSSCRVRA